MSNSKNPSHGPRWIKPVVIIAVMAVLAVAYYTNRDALSLASLAEQQESIVEYQQQHPLRVFAAAYLVYATVTGLSVPGAAAMTLLFGWFFAQIYGDAWGLLFTVVLVSFASTTGATLAFLSSRYIIGEPIQKKFGGQLAKFNTALQNEGPFYLFSLRLIPAVPFMVINLVMGLTRVPVWTFWWVSQIGMLPGTIVYVYAGTKVPGPNEILEDGASGVLTWDILLAFVLLALFPFLVRAVINRVRASKGTSRVTEST